MRYATLHSMVLLSELTDQPAHLPAVLLVLASMSWRLPTQLTVCTVISTVMLVLQLPLLISSQATPPSASCEQQVLAALRQQAAYNTNGYNLDLVWEPSFASSWNSFGCLNSLHSLRMTGAVPHLPSTWATNSSFLALEKLDFSSSQLTGTLPPEWGSLGGFPALLSLDFSRTGLTGALPAAWGSMNAFPKLVNLTLVDTSLLGSLPAAWGSQGGLRALHRLEIGSCDLVGALPPQWANASAFPTLVSLSLHDMFLTGDDCLL